MVVRSVRETESCEMNRDSQMKSWGAMAGKGNSICGKPQWGNILVHWGIVLSPALAGMFWGGADGDRVVKNEKLEHFLGSRDFVYLHMESFIFSFFALQFPKTLK